MVALLLPPCAHADIVTGNVVAIADGDTLTLLDSSKQQHRIRLAGIDAPEKNQDFGQKSKANLSAMAFNRTASADCRKRDRYQREVCVVTVDGKDLGLEQIRVGMAWWYRKYAKEQSPQNRTDYEQAELIAKVRRHGLWDSKNQVPPWEWRRNRLER
jgi:endonuclease YncB( thermonuclease family)